MENELKDIEETHKLWHLFQNEFISHSGRFYLTGASLIKAITDFTVENPEIEIIQCSDMMATSSIMVLIPHTSRAHNKVETITIVTIPQHMGDPSVLSLDDPDYLMKALKKAKNPKMEKRKCKLYGCPRYFIPHLSGCMQEYCSAYHKVKACQIRKGKVFRRINKKRHEK